MLTNEQLLEKSIYINAYKRPSTYIHACNQSNKYLSMKKVKYILMVVRRQVELTVFT
jgi:hypothetical protein